MTDNVSSLRYLRKDRAEVDARLAALERDGGGPHDGGMPPDLPERVAVLEQIAKDLRDDVKAMRADVTSLRVDMGEMKGKVSNLPTTWTMVTAIVGSTVGLLIGLAGLAFAAAKYFGPAA